MGFLVSAISESLKLRIREAAVVSYKLVRGVCPVVCRLGFSAIGGTRFEIVTRTHSGGAIT